jgi:hypothetical protein
VEDRTRLPARLPENGLSTPFRHENYEQSHLEWDRLW